MGPEDFSVWRPLNLGCIWEQKLPNELSDDQVKDLFIWRAKQGFVWGLFVDDKLVTVAELNAKALDLGQVGGVYTSADYRGQGLAKALMRQLMRDAKERHEIRKLMIFTDERNQAARKVYESLGAKQVGYFAILFGKPAHSNKQ